MGIVLLYVYRVSNDRLTALLKWYRANGLLPKEKRNAGRQNNSKTYDLDDTRRTVAFISNYADDHALVLPGRVPGFQRDDVRLMPSSETKVKVYGVRTGHLCVIWVCYGINLSMCLIIVHFVVCY